MNTEFFEALALLELLPGRAALMAAVAVVGTGTLTGQHRNDSSPLMFRETGLPAEKSSGRPRPDTGWDLPPGQGGEGGGPGRAWSSQFGCSGGGPPS